MPDRVVGGSQQVIPPEALVQLIERAQGSLESRIRRLWALERHLGAHGTSLLRRATLYKAAIIILGALVATRVVADQAVAPGSQSPLGIVIVYTTMSVILAVIGGLDGAFRPGEVATEMNFLKVRCAIVIDEVEQDWTQLVDRYGVSQQALENTYPLLEKLNKHCADIETRLAQLGSPLPNFPG